MEETYKTPKQDLMNAALKHYEEAANAIHHWNSDIPKAIKAYYSERGCTCGGYPECICDIVRANIKQEKPSEQSAREFFNNKHPRQTFIPNQPIAIKTDVLWNLMEEYARQKHLPTDEEPPNDLQQAINEIKADAQATIINQNNDMSEHAIEARAILMTCEYVESKIKK